MLANYGKWHPMPLAMGLGSHDFNAKLAWDGSYWWANSGRWRDDDGNWIVGVQLARKHEHTGESESWRFTYDQIERLVAEIEIS